MRADIKIGPKTFQERMGRAPVWIKKNITHADLTEATANTAQTVALITLPKRHAIVAVQAILVTAFKNSADAAFNTTTVSVGDTGDVDRNLTAIETNENGTEIPLKYELTSTNGVVSQTADTTVNARFSAMAAKSLVDLDTGSIDFFLCVQDFDLLTAGSSEEDS